MGPTIIIVNVRIIGWLPEEKRLWHIAAPALTFLTAFALTLLVRRVLLGWLRRRARPGSFAAALLATLGFPSLLWSAAAAIAVSLHFLELGPRAIARASDAIVIFLIVSFSLAAASVLVRMLAAYGERQGMPFAAAGLTRALTRVLVWTIGLMTLLGYLKVSITPVLTALGVGGIAVALALQDTLANFFAGLHILVERPIFVGDFIRLESGQEGVVTDIGWRTTRVRTLNGNIVVVPNVKITSGTLFNYSLPDPAAVVDLPIVVGLDADPDQVAALAREEAAAVEGVDAAFPPLVFCDPGLLPTHLQLKLLIRVRDQTQRGRILSDIRFRLLRRFRQEGVPLPNPELARYWADAPRS